MMGSERDGKGKATAIRGSPALRLWVARLIFAALLALAPSWARAALVSEDQVEREAERIFRQMKVRIPLSGDVQATEYVECVAGMIVG